MPLRYEDVVFAFDMSTIVVDGAGNRYLKDFGPHSLDARFQGGGFDPAPQLDGSLLFSGAHWLLLPLRFYAVAPTSTYWFLVQCAPSTAAGSQYIFSCAETNAGNWYGFSMRMDTAGAYTRGFSMTGVAAQPQWEIANTVTTGRRRTLSVSVETAQRAIYDQRVATVAWIAGAFGNPAYFVTQPPLIGRMTGFGQFVGRIHYLSLIRGTPMSEDMMLCNRLLAEGTKPWCVRR